MFFPRCPFVVVFIALVGAAVSRAAEKPALLKADRVAAVVPRAASDEAQRALKLFAPAEGLEVALFAAEPLLGNPVSISIDGEGRVFVAETHRARTSALDVRGYPALLADDLASRSVEDRLAFTKKHFASDWPKLGVETEVVRLVEDRDRDGKADFSAVYADGFNSPLDGAAGGVRALGGSVWFANIPSLWRLDGMDKDGRAEQRTELSRGYGVRFGWSGHDLHGLIRGPDGRLYFSVGDRGAQVKTKEGRTLALPDEGAVLRCEMDGAQLEVFCRGLRNPQDLAFDKFGNFFTGDSAAELGDRARFIHLVEGGDYGWRIGWQHHPLGAKFNPWLAEKLWLPQFAGQAAWVLPPVANIPDGPAGLAYHPGTGLSQRYDEAFFQCCFQGSSAKSGIRTWKALRFLGSFRLEDEAAFLDHCQATDVAFGPDSKLYFSAWGDGWEATGRGRIYRVHDVAATRDPRVEEVRLLLAEGFKNKAPTELSILIGHKDQRVRLEAQWELATRPEAEREFADVAGSPNKDVADQQLARVHAIWGLGMVAREADRKTPGAGAKILLPLIPLLQGEDPEVRAQTAKVLGESRVAEAYEELLKTLRDEVVVHVSFFSAQALAKLARKECVTQVLIMARSMSDHGPVLRHGYVQALAAAHDLPALQEAAQHTDPVVRMVALLALRRLERPEVAQFLTDEDPLLVIEAARAIYDVPITPALPQLAALLAKPSADEQLMLRVLGAAFRTGTPEAAKALAAFAASDAASDALRHEARELLALWPQPPARDRVTGLPRPLPAREAAPKAAHPAPAR